MTLITASPTTRRHSTLADEELAALLVLAGRGDVDAFARFYDATIGWAYDRARLRSADPELVDSEVRAVYLRAWRAASAHRASGLSPKAWLLRGNDAA